MMQNTSTSGLSAVTEQSQASSEWAELNEINHWLHAIAILKWRLIHEDAQVKDVPSLTAGEIEAMYGNEELLSALHAKSRNRLESWKTVITLGLVKEILRHDYPTPFLSRFYLDMIAKNPAAVFDKITFDIAEIFQSFGYWQTVVALYKYHVPGKNIEVNPQVLESFLKTNNMTLINGIIEAYELDLPSIERAPAAL